MSTPWKARVYIAGPYTNGDKEANVRIALDAAEEAVACGLCPYVPHLTHYWEVHRPHDWTFWLILHGPWLASCQALLRLPGESQGSDIEAGMARRLGLKVFESVAEMRTWAGSI